MLYYENANGDKGQWHTDMTLKFNQVRENAVVLVRADGVELAHIRLCLHSIPMSDGVSVTWREPWAQFIADNA